ncbi:MAG: phage portal protein, partial [Candidatus Riflebacteria bacterium]|nr:phage portal protein [Candidatus Riflebacteria bacterium]
MNRAKELLKNLKKSVTENGGLGSVIDTMIAQLAPGWALQRQQTRNAFNASSEYYRGAARNRLRADWTTRATKPDAPKWEQNTLVARSRDIERNDPVGAGLVDTMGINVVGKGLRPQSKIRAEVLGCSEEQADEYRTMAESAFEAFCKTADAREISTYDHLQFMALTQICRDGECVARPVWSEKPYKKFARAIQLIEREMLCNSMSADEEEARGIIYGPMG